MSPSPALTNTDILYEIFHHLSVFPYYNDDLRLITRECHGPRYEETRCRSKALASAVRTCKAFSDPAYDVLWTVLPTIAPIMSTISGCRIETDKDMSSQTLGHRTYDVDGNISASERARFNRLARRVRFLNLDHETITGSFLHLLTLSQRSDSPPPLFPNLRLLIWRESLGSAEKQEFLRSLCAAPNLSVLDIEHGGMHGYGCVEQDLSITIHTRPDLLHIRTDSALNSAGERVLMTFHHLRSARLTAISDALFNHLSTLPQLEELCAVWPVHRGLTHPATTSVANAPFSTGSFPVLRHLELSGPFGCETVFRILSAVSSTSLSSLSVVFQENLSADALGGIEGLSSLPVLQCLRRLQIRVYFDISPFRPFLPVDQGHNEHLEIVLSEFLRPLLQLRALEDVSLDVQLRLWSISNNDIKTIINAWPRLVRLSICDDTHEHLQKALQPGGVHVGRPSLSTLVALAESCRRLETLDVEVSDVSGAELVRLETHVAKQIAPQLGPPQTALQSITFARGDYLKRIVLPDDNRLAQALHALFPHLGGLGGPIGDTAGMEGQPLHYKRPQDDIKVLRLLRRLERL